MLSVVFIGIFLFVGTGGTVLAEIARNMAGYGIGPNKFLTSALLLNIALIIFGWRRYTELTREVSNSRQAEDEARHLAEIDPLTGCLNRRSMTNAMEDMLAQSKESASPIALLMLDIDHFKQINDFNGHSVGDAILQQCANRIRQQLPQNALFARMGGDEFACAVPFRADQAHHIDKLAAAIVSSVACPVDVDGLTIETTVSVGVVRSDYSSVIQPEALDAEALLRSADIGLYQAKKLGRNRFTWFENALESELRRRTDLEKGIRHGVSNGEFVPYYEQQIDTRTGSITGFEMLARWNSTEFVGVGPDTFIPIAEEMELISELSECVIKQALRDARDWDSKLTLSVNISPLQLRDPWFAQKLLKILVAENFPPSRLEIEITESCLHENIAVVQSLIASMQNQGIRVSLDDFGTGYSSLAQLKTLPFDRIKIDRSFVTNLPNNADSTAIVKAIIDLGKGLGLPITAEGIENAEVLEKLQELGDFKGQGYLYGQPATATATREKLAGLNLLADDRDSINDDQNALSVIQKRIANG